MTDLIILNNFKSKLFIKYFISYVVLVLIATMLYTVFVFIMTKRLTSENDNRNYNNTLNQGKMYFDSQLNDIMNINNKLNNSKIIRDLYFRIVVDGFEADPIMMLNTINEIKSIIGQNMNVYDVLVFFYNGDKIFGSSAVYKLEEKTNDFDEIPLFYNGKINDFMKSAAATNSFLSDFLIINHNLFTGSGTAKGKIFILMNNQNLENSINKIIQEENVYLNIYFNENTILRSNDDTNFKEVKDLYEADSSIYSAVSYDLVVTELAFAKNIKPLIQFLVFSILGIGVISIFLAYFFSKFNYNPVKKIILSFKENLLKTKNYHDELFGIEKEIRYLMNEKNELIDKFNSSRQLVKQAMLHTLLTNNEFDSEFMDEMNRNGIFFDMKFFCVAAFNFVINEDNQGKNFNNDDLEDIRILAKCTQNIEILTGAKLHLCKINSNKVALVINTNNNIEIKDLIASVFEACCRSVGIKGFDITVGVGNTVEKTDYVNVSYREAIKALDYKITEGNNKIIYYSIVSKKENGGCYYPLDTEINLIRLLKRGDFDNIKTIYNKIFEKNVVTFALSLYGAKCLFYEMFSTTLKIFSKLELHDKGIIDYDIIDSLDSIEKIYNYFLDIYKTACEIIVNNGMHYYSKFDESILKYINDNCFNSELSLDSISDKFKVPLKYISLLFKNKVGHNYLDYVNGKRIDKALILLKNTDDRMEDICEKLGYTSVVTFRRQFRKGTNMTPGQYREYIRN